MNDQEKFLLLMTLLAVAANGWGLATIALLTRDRYLADTPVRLQPAMNISIGVALFITVGGFFVAGNAAYFPFLLGWQIVGTCFSCADVILNKAMRIRQRLFKLRTLPAAFAAFFLVFMALGPALSGIWNPNDDAPAYSYLGQRLLSTGGLIDPFNTRRLNSYGAAELFQALIIKTVNPLAGIGIEWFFFLLLTIALFVRSLDRRFAVVALLTIGLGIEVLHPIGVWANVAPAFSGTALTLALARLLTEHGEGMNLKWVYIISGLLLAAVFALRLEFVLPASLLVFATAFHRHKRSSAFTQLLIAGVVTTVSLSGWAIALYRSSATPIFPLFVSYWTQASWFVNPAIHTFGQHVSNFIAIAGTYQWDIGLLGSLGLALGSVFLAKRIARVTGWTAENRVNALVRTDIVWTLVVGCIALLGFEEYSLAGGAVADLMRYALPSLLVLVLFTLDRIWVLALELARPQNVDERTKVTTTQKCYALGLPIIALCFFALFIGNHPTIFQEYFSENLHESIAAAIGKPVLVDTSNGAYIRSEQRYYTKINDLIPKHSYLLAAVELPGLLDMGKYSFTTLDEPGGTSPPPHISYYGSARQLVAYLRHDGINGIVASTPAASGLYNFQTAEAELQSGVPAYRKTAQYTIEWDRLLREVERLYRSVNVGTLRYISFSRPRIGK